MESLIQDLRFGAKLLGKERGFTATAILTLALCIGANAAIFGVLNAVVLRPVPLPESDRLVTMFNAYPGAGFPRVANATPDYYDRRELTDVFESVALFGIRGATIGETGSTERVMATGVTPGFFELIQTQPMLGRSFVPEEGEPGENQKAILSYGLWQRLFGGDQQILGRDLRVNGEPLQIVGVMPEGFQFISAENEYWFPLAFTEEQRGPDSRHSNQWSMIARLQPGVTIPQARSRVDALNAELLEQSPQFRDLLVNTGFFTELVGFKADLIRDIRPTLWLLWAGVLVVLLIGIVNIANLMLVRANVRMREIATRVAIGATQGRITRQLLTESVLLAVLGGSLGVLVGAAGLRLISTLGVERTPFGVEIVLDAQVLFATLLLSVAAGILLGAIPVLSVRRADLISIFRKEERTGTAGRGALLLRNGLVVSQISIAFVLLIAAGLVLYSFLNVLRVDPGFKPEGVLTANVVAAGSRYQDRASVTGFTVELLDRVRALPGVRTAGAATGIPFGNEGFRATAISVEGYVPQEGESIRAPLSLQASPGFLEALEIPLREGRLLQESDDQENLNVVVIDSWMARHYWGDESPLGKRIYNGVPDLEEESDPNRWFTVVGVVDEIYFQDLSEPERLGAIYYSYKQVPFAALRLAVKTDGDPASLTSGIRAALAEIDPELPLYSERPMLELINESLESERSTMMLLVIFAGVALFLSAVGIYGVISYTVTQRRKEISIRMALGSDSGGVFKLVLGQGVRVLAVGLVIGLIGTYFVTRLLTSFLFGVQPTEAIVFVLVAVLLALIAVAATIIPAQRATRIKPSVALNLE
jgi:predicted permease